MAGLALSAILLVPATSPSQFDLRRSSELPGAQRLQRVVELAGAIAQRQEALTPADEWALAITLDRLCEEHKVDPFLILSIIEVESQFRRDAVSTAGARGLMQLRPFVAESLIDDDDPPVSSDDLNQMAHNVKLGTTYFQQLMRRFDNNPSLALAAYNQGPSRISSLLRNGQPIPRAYSQRVFKIYNQLTSAEI